MPCLINQGLLFWYDDGAVVAKTDSKLDSKVLLLKSPTIKPDDSIDEIERYLAIKVILHD